MLSRTLYIYFTYFCVLSAAFLYTVEGLKCYQCNSNTHTHCTEYFDKENSNIKPMECFVHDARYCVKTTGMYKGEVGTHRFCSSSGWGDVCEYSQRKGDYREYRSCIYTCSGDECNNSHSFKSSTWVLILTFAFSYLFRTHFFI